MLSRRPDLEIIDRDQVEVIIPTVLNDHLCSCLFPDFVQGKDIEGIVRTVAIKVKADHERGHHRSPHDIVDLLRASAPDPP